MPPDRLRVTRRVFLLVHLIYRKNKNSFLMVSGSCLCEPSLVPAFIVALSKRGGVVEVTWKRAPEDGRAVNCAGRQNPRPPMRPPGSVDRRCGIGQRRRIGSNRARQRILLPWLSRSGSTPKLFLIKAAQLRRHGLPRRSCPSSANTVSCVRPLLRGDSSPK